MDIERLREKLRDLSRHGVDGRVDRVNDLLEDIVEAIDDIHRRLDKIERPETDSGW